MILPPDFVDENRPSFVWNLYKSLYGLSQTDTLYHGFRTYLFSSIGLKTNSTLFFTKIDFTYLYVLIYVYDIIITDNNLTVVSDLIRPLVAKLSITTLPLLNDFLNIEVILLKTSIIFSQQRYTLDLSKKTMMEGIKPVQTPTFLIF